MSSQPSPLQQQTDRLRRSYEDLRKQASMDDIAKKLSDQASAIAALPDQIAALRGRGYAFAGYLERKAAVLSDEWREIGQHVRDALSDESARIQPRLDEIADLWRKLDQVTQERGVTMILTQVDRSASQLSDQVTSARKRIEGLFGQVPDNVSQTQRQLRQLNGYLDQAQQAKVSWTPTEALFTATKAKWLRAKKDEPEGVLFLTDQRLIFERREKEGGRFGFGGQEVQEELWAIPVGAIAEIRSEDKGLFGGKDLVHLTLSSGDFREISLEVKDGLDSKAYAQQLGRAVSGDLESERVIPLDEAQAQAVREAPTACPTCGAALPPLVRGANELRCNYCGTVVRV